MAKKTRRTPVSTDKRFKKNNADLGPRERWQHAPRQLLAIEESAVLVAKTLHEHALDPLLELKIISAEEREAGLRFFQDYKLANIESRITASYAAHHPVGAGGVYVRERDSKEEAAYIRWRHALQALHPRWQDVVVHVCCVNRAPNLAQVPRLVAALKGLARYYGLAARPK